MDRPEGLKLATLQELLTELQTRLSPMIVVGYHHTSAPQPQAIIYRPPHTDFLQAAGMLHWGGIVNDDQIRRSFTHNHGIYGL